MSPDVVVDIGNTRIKWGTRADPKVVHFLPADDETEWESRARELLHASPALWAIASVHPGRTARFGLWLQERGDRATQLSVDQVPLHLDVDEPDRTGIDRLLAAYAAHRLCPTEPVVVVSVGTAVTIDLVDEHGVFHGGLILPGPQLMANALHTHTALLPLLEVPVLGEAMAPGRTTESSIRGGIDAAIRGAIDRAVDRYAEISGPPLVVATGGGGMTLVNKNVGHGKHPVRFLPTLILDGIRQVCEALP